MTQRYTFRYIIINSKSHNEKKILINLIKVVNYKTTFMLKLNITQRRKKTPSHHYSPKFSTMLI